MLTGTFCAGRRGVLPIKTYQVDGSGGVRGGMGGGRSWSDGGTAGTGVLKSFLVSGFPFSFTLFLIQVFSRMH